MDFQITQKPAFTVVGMALRVSTKDGENLRVIPEFWMKCLMDGSHGRLQALASESNVTGDTTLGICSDFSPDMQEFTYMVAAETSKKDAVDGFTAMSIPALTWAVFEAKGAMPDAIQALWSKIWSEFFQAGEYSHAAGPDIEVYSGADGTSPDYQFEVWVPVTKN